MVGLDVNVSILFWLKVSVKTTVVTLAEVFMESSFVLFFSVFAGLVGILPTQARD
jgi:hypothetical protein